MCTISNPYCPAMPEKPNPSPLARKKPRIAVRPRPQEDSIIEQLFKPNDPETVEAMNAATRERRAAKLDSRPSPKPPTVLVIGREFSPKNDIEQTVYDICLQMADDESPLDPREAARQILASIVAPHRVAIHEIAIDHDRRLSELREAYQYGKVS